MPSSWISLRISTILLLLLLSAQIYGQNLSLFSPKEPVTVHFLSETPKLSATFPQTFWVGFHFQLQEHWHLYWRNPGDSGLPLSIQWKLPPFIQAGSIQWPYPQKISDEVLTSYGYEEEVLFLVPLEFLAPPPTDIQEIVLEAELRWLVCEEICISGSATPSLSLPLTPSSLSPHPSPLSPHPLFEKTRKRLPASSSLWKIELEATKDLFILSLEPLNPELPPLEDLLFFPYDQDLIQYHASQTFSRTSSGYCCIIERASSNLKTPKKFRGILVCSSGWEGSESFKALEFECTTPQPRK